MITERTSDEKSALFLIHNSAPLRRLFSRAKAPYFLQSSNNMDIFV